MTIKEIKAKYIGKRFNDSDKWSVVTKVVSVKQNDGTGTVVLLSGSTGDYDIEAILDRKSGINLIPNRSRCADSISDAVDVAMEMYEGRN